MAVVITIAQQKGGAGKTMLAANLAAALAAKRRVAVLDIDPQGSLTRWHALRGAGRAAITLSAVSGWRLGGELDRLRRDHDVLLVDSPPHLDTDARRAVREATLVLAPVQASLPDLWATEGTAALAAAERRPMRLVMNRVPNTPRLRARALAAVAASGHTMLPAMLGDRQAFPQAFAMGLGVIEADPRTVAASEMRALLDVVWGMLS